MNPRDDNQYVRLSKEKQKLGLFFGLLAGGTFAIAAWGIDAFALAQAQADLPFLKLAIGGAFCLLVGGFVGWLTERLDNALVGLLGWVLAGASFAWLASQLPFGIQSRFIELFDPTFRGVSLYPLPAQNINALMVIVYTVVLLTSALAGALETNIVLSAYGAYSRLARVLVLAVAIPLFFFGGNAADDVNEPFRLAVLGVDKLIEDGIRTEGQAIDKETARELRLRVLDPIRPVYQEPRRLVMGGYDPVYLDTISVYIDFDGTWAMCSVFLGQPTSCRLSDQLYARNLACVLRGEDPEQKCHVILSQSGSEFLAANAASLGPTPLMQTLEQRGDTTYLGLEDSQGESYCCRFTGSQIPITLEECEPAAEDLVTPNLELTEVARRPTATPTAAAPATPEAAPSGEVQSGQEQALLQPYQGDLESLPDIPQYALALDVDFANHVYEGKLQLDYTNLETTALDKLYFRLFPNGGRSYGSGSLEVTQVELDGARLDTALPDPTTLEVPLPQPLAPGGKIRLMLTFQGLVPSPPGDTGYGIYSFREEILTMANFYPILAVYDDTGWNLDPVSNIGDSVYADAALYTLDLIVNQEVMVVSTGVEASRNDFVGKHTYRFVSGPVREFFLAMSPAFKQTNALAGGSRIYSYTITGVDEAARSSLVTTVSILRALNDLAGNYPYKELEVVQVPLDYAAGVEYPGVILMGRSLYEDYTEQRFTYVLAHEVAHQWWYNVVGNDVIDDPWMDEGLASYASALYFEAIQGEAGYRGAIGSFENRYTSYLENGGPQLGISHGLSYFETGPGKPEQYSPTVYTRGALFFKALRDTLGDQAFFDGLRAYYLTYKYQIATPQDLQSVFEQVSGRQLAELFAEWLETAE